MRVFGACLIKKGGTVAPFLPKFKKGNTVKTKAIRLIRMTVFFAAFALTACGGGGGGSADALAPTACSQQNLSACGGSGAGTAGTTDGGVTTAAALFTTAPSAVTTVSGAAPTYTVGGGTAPYTATSGNTSVVTVGISGKTLTLEGIAGGGTKVAVVDAKGASVTIDVIVEAKGTGTPPSIFPAAITVGDCTTNIPFIFTGGTAPFTIFTSDNVAIPASAALPLGVDSYFMASVLSLYLSPDSVLAGVKTVIVPRKATVTVLDSQSRTATATITIPLAHPTCPDNPLLKITPASANAHVSEVLAFQVSGGVAPYTVTSNTGIVSVPAGSLSTSSFNAQALAAGTALLTVHSADGQNANITFTVFP